MEAGRIPTTAEVRAAWCETSGSDDERRMSDPTPTTAEVCAAYYADAVLAWLRGEDDRSAPPDRAEVAACGHEAPGTGAGGVGPQTGAQRGADEEGEG